MKKLFTSFLFIVYSLLSVTAQGVCNLGFTFTISKNHNWGINEPVVTKVFPGTPAEKSGLKVNDIILEINGNGTYLKNYDIIKAWFAEEDKSMNISVRNLKNDFHQMIIDKDCRDKNALSEALLAPVFAFYSLEDVQERSFLMPVKTRIHEKAVFTNYHTFDFAPSDENSPQIDEQITNIMERNLRKLGLVRNENDPDFIIQTYYSYQKNPGYNPQSPTDSYKPTWRFDTKNNRLIKVPIYQPNEPVRTNDVMYNLEFGFRFFDNKYFEDLEDLVLIWESDVVERLSGSLGLVEYLEMNLPLILSQFPYGKDSDIITVEVNHLKYNYTGLNYDMNYLNKIVSVDKDSPAEKAGILPGDIVREIGAIKFSQDPRKITDQYRRFISETMDYRDQRTKYEDIKGNENCMFWNIQSYNKISQAINSNRYNAVFSYLFNFNQYINWETPRSLTIGVERNGKKMDFEVIPLINSYNSIKSY